MPGKAYRSIKKPKVTGAPKSKAVRAYARSRTKRKKG